MTAKSKGAELDWPEFRRQLAASFRGLRSPLALLILGTGWVIAVVAGPFGSFDTMPWHIRALYWGVVIGGGTLAGAGARACMATVLGPRAPLLFDLGASALVTLPLAPVIRAARGTLDPVLGPADLDPVSIAVNTFLIVAGVFVLRRQFGAEQPAGYLRGAPAPSVPATRLHQRLALAEGEEILRLSGSDHVVEVATTTGVVTLRLRLADAIAEMEPVPGICTHRSHWVALSAIVGLQQEEAGKPVVLLCNGDRVPVSRTYRPRLVSAGLLNPAERQDQPR